MATFFRELTKAKQLEVEVITIQVMGEVIHTRAEERPLQKGTRNHEENVRESKLIVSHISMTSFG